MSNYVNLFLKTEITCIPRLLHKYVGYYYNNALCNGATWVFVLWSCLHFMFEGFLKAFLKKLRYKDYVCDRLIKSLWYLGYYGTALCYCGATIFQNKMELFNFKKMYFPSSANLPIPLIIGYTMISTFYLHSSAWEGLRHRLVFNMIRYFLLGLFIILSYILRIVEISFTLTSLISIAQICIEVVRILTVLSDQNIYRVNVFLSTILIIATITYTIIYVFLIPISFIVPMCFKIVSDYPDTLLKLLLLVNILWLFVEIYRSVLYKFIYCWLFHIDCDNLEGHSIINCTLFEPRNDEAYHIERIRQEIKTKEDEMMSLRKPKNNKNMLIQTLKCMVAIKRKLSEKKLAENLSDSDDSEKSEDSDDPVSQKDIELEEEIDLDDDEQSENENSLQDSDKSVILNPKPDEEHPSEDRNVEKPNTS